MIMLSAGLSSGAHFSIDEYVTAADGLGMLSHALHDWALWMAPKAPEASATLVQVALALDEVLDDVAVAAP